MKVLLILLSALLSMLSYAVKASDITALNPIESLVVNTKFHEKDIPFNVTLPASYQSKPNKTYVLMFNVHPRMQPVLAGMHDWTSHNGGWPWLETIVVTPAGYDEAFHRLYMDYVEGKNQQFLSFLEDELIASLSEKYRLNGFRIYSGFTGNATTGLGILLDKPSLFNAYILASPVLANHPLKPLEKVKAQLAKLPKKPAYLMLSTSDSSYEQAQLESFAELSNLASELAPENLQLTIKRFDGTYYMSQPVLSTAYAIEEIFHDVHETLAPDSAISMQGADAILNHYQYLSNEKYGFTVSAQPSLKKLGNSLLESKPDKAVAVLTKATEAYPESAFAFDALAAAYAKLDQPEKAVENQQKAVELSGELVEFWQRKHREKLEKYQQALGAH